MASEIKTVPNQNVILIKKADADKNNPYTVINLEAIDYAAARIKGEQFKLWMYLAKNQNNYRFALSKVDFCRWGAVSDSTYHRAIKTLLEMGFLVRKEEGSNIYYFYEMPTENNVTTKDDKEIEIPLQKIEQQKLFRF